MSMPILHVEDREEDVFLLRYAFKRAEVTNPVQVVTDGQMAIDYLSGNGEFRDRDRHPLPGLVLLDLQLPHVPGLDVLGWIKRQPPYKRLIVLILSSSIYENDIIRAYELGANGFMVKPSDANTLAEMCQAMKRYWLIHNRPPPDFVAP